MMYLKILKKDLKRKKTMNIILLLFTVLAAMFVSSGVSNVFTVMSGTEYFLQKAGLGDFVIITQNREGGVEEILKKSTHLSSYKKENCFWASKDDLFVGKNSLELKSNTVVIQSLQKNGIQYFQMNNEKLTHVKKGEIYVTAGFLKTNHLEIGDSMQIRLHGLNKTYRIAGEMKDALLGSDMMGNIRLIISDEDYEDYSNEESLTPYSGCIFYVNSNDVRSLASEITKGKGILFSGGRDMIKLCYVMEMIVAMIVLVLSVCLVVVSFVLLKFVISFSIHEEYREIGVMKAIGIRNFKIRSMYITKYVGIAIAGGVIGMIAGIPFGKMLIQTVSQKMLLGNNYGIVLNIIGAIFVILIMCFFAYIFTNKVKKLTPVDAIRSGQTGERFKKNAALSCKKSHLRNAGFMAVNDILSSPRRFITITLSFFLCSIFVFGVVLVTDTMKSDRLIGTFGKKSDVYITDTKLLKLDYMSKDGDEEVENSLDEMEQRLSELGMPGSVSMEIWYKYLLTSDGKTSSVTFQQNKRTKTTDYEYTEGTAPQNANEIAITKEMSKQINAKIGDTVTIDFGTEKRECMVVAYFQTMNQLGTVIRLHEDAKTSMACASAMMAYLIEFDDQPDEDTINKRIQKLKADYGVKDVFNSTQYCENCIGVADTFDAVAKLLLVITCIVVVLVTVLMECSFVSNEKTDIALLKAIGFTNRFILRWQVLRFMIVTVFSEVLAVILTYPVTKLWCDPIWKMMGATNVSYYFKPVSLIVIYPGIILIINFLAVLLTSLCTRKIKSRDVMNIE